MTYIEELQDAIRNFTTQSLCTLRLCPFKEIFQGQTVWEGEVKVFDLPDLTARIGFMRGLMKPIR